jgi:hypothetical protein
VALLSGATALRAQIQVELKFSRLQYISYEPVFATIAITNLAGRDVDFRDVGEQRWFGFEVTGRDGQPVPPDKMTAQPPLHIEAGKRVTQKINLTPLFPVHDFGAYHVRAHVYFPDLNRFFYSPAKVFEVTDARPVWQRTVGVPTENGVRTYSLLSNRFPDHTSLYVRVADQDRGVVYATYSLGRIIAFDEPHAEIDRQNQLHVLHCAAPRTWSYSRVGLNGELINHSTFMATKSRPRLVRDTDGAVAVHGGMVEAPAPPDVSKPAPKLSDRPNED